MRIAFCVALSLVLALSLCACSQPGFRFVAPTPRPTPSQTPIQEDDHILSLPHGPAAYRTRLISAFFSALSISETIADSVYSGDYRAIASHVEQYNETIARLSEDFERAAIIASDETGQYLDEPTKLNVRIAPLSWQYLGAYLYICDSAKLGRTAAARALTQSLRADANITLDDAGYALIELNIDYVSFYDLLSVLSAHNGETVIDGRFAYAYMHTVFDDEGKEKEYELPEPGGNLKTGLAAPLEKMNLRDSWFAARDGGARKHTGTDIVSRANTPIHSCTSGVILRISFGSKSGNYVIVRDEYGYDFYYMHMIRRTVFLKEGDEVEAGDIIGHIGNTGNSDTNHLHLSIISPDDRYVNPYPYLLESVFIEPAALLAEEEEPALE